MNQKRVVITPGWQWKDKDKLISIVEIIIDKILEETYKIEIKKYKRPLELIINQLQFWHRLHQWMETPNEMIKEDKIQINHSTQMDL
mgnify:CR=1 FL=1